MIRKRVLIIDDSALVRRILTGAIGSTPDLEVVGAAPDAATAERMIRELKPDVLSLDLQMPGMDGITFLRKLAATGRPVPTVVVSSLAQAGCRIAMDALEAGAVDVVAKPGGIFSAEDLRSTLTTKLRAAAHARVSSLTTGSAISSKTAPLTSKAIFKPAAAAGHPRVVIGIGASTGGTEAVRAVLQDLPANIPPIVIVQHIPAQFSKAFAQRLDHLCRFHVKEAEDGDPVTAGVALVAPGDYHLTVVEGAKGLVARLSQTEKVCYQRPAVDVLFDSLSKLRKSGCIGVILTGMGSDGAEGLLKMRNTGARTIVQDEASCVVYGMPKQALQNGAAERVLPLNQMARVLTGMFSATDRVH